RLVVVAAERSSVRDVLYQRLWFLWWR
ncbi:hypothetical protein A2U01_0047017, partial [Trifolium medium]|nr:hypothetical protein [Trifolium medium]